MCTRKRACEHAHGSSGRRRTRCWKGRTGTRKEEEEAEAEEAAGGGGAERIASSTSALMGTGCILGGGGGGDDYSIDRSIDGHHRPNNHTYNKITISHLRRERVVALKHVQGHCLQVPVRLAAAAQSM